MRSVNRLNRDDETIDQAEFGRFSTNYFDVLRRATRIIGLGPAKQIVVSLQTLNNGITEYVVPLVVSRSPLGRKFLEQNLRRNIAGGPGIETGNPTSEKSGETEPGRVGKKTRLNALSIDSLIELTKNRPSLC